MIRILFVCHRADLTGAPLCLVDLVAHLDRDRFDPVVVLGEDGPLRNRLLEAGVDPLIVPRKGTRGLLQPWELRRLIANSKPSLVQVSSAVGFSKSAALAARSLRLPVVWHLHDDFALDKFRRRLPWVRRLASAVVACSRNVGDAIPSAKTEVVPNGVSLTPWPREREEAERRLGLAPAEFRFGFVGAFMPHKNVHRIVEAASKVLRDMPETSFVAVGGGEKPDYRRQVIDKANAKELGGRFVIHDEVAEIGDYYACSDVLLLPSSHECFPRVILEAAAAAVPSIASPVGDVPTMIADGESGWLLPEQGGSSETLAETMLHVRRLGRDGVAEFGRRARQNIASRFSLQQYVGRFEHIWAQLGATDAASVS